MKQIVKVIFACIILLGGFCGNVEAQKTGKKSRTSSSAAVAVQKLSDGYVNVEGHTYSTNEMGMKLSITFAKNGVAKLTIAANGQSEQTNAQWEYWGNGFYGVYTYVGDPNTLKLEVSDDGKKLYCREDAFPNDPDPLTFTLVK